MLTQSNRFAYELVKLVEEEMNRLKDQIALGNMSIEQYKSSTGKIEGLRTALEFVNEAAAIIDGRERNPKQTGEL